MRLLRSIILIAAGLSALPTRAVTNEFIAAFRDSAGAYALSEGGSVYRLGAAHPSKLTQLSASHGGAYHWLNTPTSFVRWRDGWIVSDASTTLLRFRQNGIFDRKLELPVRADRLAVAAGKLIVHNLLASNRAEQYWESSDGVAVTRLPVVNVAKFASPLDNLVVIAGSQHGELYSATLIGAASMRAISPGGKERTIPIAYERTRARASFDHPQGIVDDITSYSQPMRDLDALPSGGVVVLRNREDLSDAAGKPSPYVGRRADLYDGRGTHVATAVFPVTMRWVVYADAKSIACVTKEGQAYQAVWGKPIEARVW
jgi:hypothetical protein